MNARSPFRSTMNPRQHRGSILINATIGLLVCVVILGAVQIGYLFFAKRELQRSADMAALAGAKAIAATAGDTAGCTTARGAAQSNLTNNKVVGLAATGSFVCGAWDESYTEAMHFKTTVTPFNAVRATVSVTPLVLVPGVSFNALQATAVAHAADPLANLSIRTTLATVDSSKSAILNAVVGGLLGGSLNLSVASWQGLVNTNVTLLTFLDALAVRLNLSAGDYDGVLNAQTTVGNLLGALISAVTQQQGAASVSVTALNAILSQTAAIKDLTLNVADLLSVDNTVPASALNTTLGVFDLLTGIVQLGNSSSSVSANISSSLLGLATTSLYLKVTEPEQLSAFGSPRLIDPSITNPWDDPNRSYVRTAQVRLLVSVGLSAVTSLTTFLNNLLATLGPVTSFLNSVLSLNLVDALGSLLNGLVCAGNGCTLRNITYVKLLDKVDVILDVGGGQAYVNAYDCGTPKTLDVRMTTEASRVRVGLLDLTTPAKVAAAMATASDVSIPRAPVLSMGYIVGRPSSCTLLICSNWVYRKGTTWVSTQAAADYIPEMALTVGLNTSVGQTSRIQTYTNPPEIESTTPAYATISASNIVNSLKTTLNGISIQSQGYGNSVLGTVFTLVGNIVSTANTLLSTLITVLGGLLDPLINNLLSLLGIDVANTQVSARMSCSRGAELVY